MAFDPSIYEQQRRNLQTTFAQQQALNTYRRYLAETAGQRPITQIEEAAFGAQKQVPRLTANYGKRGLYGMGVRSGAYNKALGDYASERARQLGYARTDLANQQRGYDLAETQGQESYQNALKDLEANKSRQIAADAAALLELR
jgi:hypothetical protein